MAGLGAEVLLDGGLEAESLAEAASRLLSWRVMRVVRASMAEACASAVSEEAWTDWMRASKASLLVLRSSRRWTVQVASGGPLRRKAHRTRSWGQEKTNHVLWQAGIESLDNLPVEGDDEALPAGDLEDFVPREHDHEAAWRKYGPGQDGGNGPGRA